MRVVRDPIRYGFATGRARVLETRLLGRSTFERLLDARTFDEQRRILSETPYGGYFDDARTTDDVERALSDSLARTHSDFLGKANLPEPLLAYFGLRHDLANVRAVLKAEVLGVPAEELADPLAGTSVASLRSGEGLGDELAEAMREVRERASGDSGDLDLELIDAAADAVLYRRLAETAKAAKSAFLTRFTQRAIDIANCRVFIRTRVREIPVARVEGLFIEGGSIEPERFVRMYRQSVHDAAVAIAETRVFGDIDATALLDPRRIDPLAKVALAGAIREARRVAIGPEPVVAYALSREAEVAVLRTLLMGRLVGVDTDVMRERIRDVV